MDNVVSDNIALNGEIGMRETEKNTLKAELYSTTTELNKSNVESINKDKKA